MRHTLERRRHFELREARRKVARDHHRRVCYYFVDFVYVSVCVCFFMVVAVAVVGWRLLKTLHPHPPPKADSASDGKSQDSLYDHIQNGDPCNAMWHVHRLLRNPKT